MHNFITTLRYVGGVIENIGGNEIGCGGGISTRLGLPANAISFPDEEMRGIGQPGRHAITDEMVGEIIGLNDNLGIVCVRRVLPATPFDINLAIRERRSVAPGEQTKRDVLIEIIHRRIQFKPVTARSKRARRHDLGTFPRIRPVGDA